LAWWQQPLLLEPRQILQPSLQLESRGERVLAGLCLKGLSEPLHEDRFLRVERLGEFLLVDLRGHRAEIEVLTTGRGRPDPLHRRASHWDLSSFGRRPLRTHNRIPIDPCAREPSGQIARIPNPPHPRPHPRPDRLGALDRPTEQHPRHA
jgi:hypothetical protein